MLRAVVVPVLFEAGGSSHLRSTGCPGDSGWKPVLWMSEKWPKQPLGVSSELNETETETGRRRRHHRVVGNHHRVVGSGDGDPRTVSLTMDRHIRLPICSLANCVQEFGQFLRL